MRKGSWRVRSGTVRITLGAPIPVEGYGLERRDQLIHDAREALLELRGGAARPPIR